MGQNSERQQIDAWKPRSVCRFLIDFVSWYVYGMSSRRSWNRHRQWAGIYLNIAKQLGENMWTDVFNATWIRVLTVLCYASRNDQIPLRLVSWMTTGGQSHSPYLVSHKGTVTHTGCAGLWLRWQPSPTIASPHPERAHSSTIVCPSHPKIKNCQRSSQKNEDTVNWCPTMQVASVPPNSFCDLVCASLCGPH